MAPIVLAALKAMAAGAAGAVGEKMGSNMVNGDEFCQVLSHFFDFFIRYLHFVSTRIPQTFIIGYASGKWVDIKNF